MIFNFNIFCKVLFRILLLPVQRTSIFSFYFFRPSLFTVFNKKSRHCLVSLNVVHSLGKLACWKSKWNLFDVTYFLPSSIHGFSVWVENKVSLDLVKNLWVTSRRDEENFCVINVKLTRKYIVNLLKIFLLIFLIFYHKFQNKVIFTFSSVNWNF